MAEERPPAAAEHAPAAPAFDPVPLRYRRDGWTPARQAAFIQWLAKGLRQGCAAGRVGMSRKAAYALRARPGGEDFAAAWDEAAAIARRRRAALRPPGDWGRAVEGVLWPVRYRGRIVAWERRLDNAALLRLLRRTQRLLEKR